MKSVLRGSLCGLALLTGATAYLGGAAIQSAYAQPATHSSENINPADATTALDSSRGIRLPDLPDDVAVDLSNVLPIDLGLPVPPEAIAVIESEERRDTTASLPALAEPWSGRDAIAGEALPASESATLSPALFSPAPVAPEQNTPEVILPELPTAVVTIAPGDSLNGAVLPPKLQPSRDLAKAIGDRLTIIAGQSRLPESDRKAILDLYQSRLLEPLWTDANGLTSAGKAIAATLRNASDHGLNTQDYSLPGIPAADDDLAELELRLTAHAVIYARDARGARLDPRRLSKLITPRLDVPPANDVIVKLSGSPDAGATLAGFNPPHPGYKALKAKLLELRGTREPAQPMVRIPAGPVLRVGMRDARVPLIRARLNLGPAQADEPVFDRALATAVAEFQRSAGLPVNGIAGRATIDAMQSPAISRLEADLIANMERWRWLPADLGESHIHVNIPQYQVRLMRDGVVALESRAIIGKPESPTAVFSDSMDHLVVNPSWFVPPSILKKEFIPGLAADPDYAAKRGFVVTRRGNNLTVRQPPGERNALGNIKFMFPNEHAIYLHDTPGRHLFANSRRAFSHGCVRVDQPFRLAAQILESGTNESWTETRLRRMIGGGERPIRLTRPLPVHLTYFTQVAEADGTLASYEDLYGFHRLVRQGLGFGG